jgi:hypothetical protein
MTGAHLHLRAGQPTDANALAELMLDAYRGTIMTTKRLKTQWAKSKPISPASVEGNPC